MSWTDPPDHVSVYDALKRRAAIKGELEMLGFRLRIVQAEITKAKPRDTAVRVIGYDEATSKELYDIQYRMAELAGELELVEVDIKYNDYHRDMFKSLSFRERF